MKAITIDELRKSVNIRFTLETEVTWDLLEIEKRIKLSKSILKALNEYRKVNTYLARAKFVTSFWTALDSKLTIGIENCNEYLQPVLSVSYPSEIVKFNKNMSNSRRFNRLTYFLLEHIKKLENRKAFLNSRVFVYGILK